MLYVFLLNLDNLDMLFVSADLLMYAVAKISKNNEIQVGKGLFYKIILNVYKVLTVDLFSYFLELYIKTIQTIFGTLVVYRCAHFLGGKVK